MRRLIPIIRQWWYRQHGVCENEFDARLGLDIEYWADIKQQADYWTNKLRWYEIDLAARRRAAHDADMKRQDVSCTESTSNRR
jgi:hypothetical protein